MVQRLLRKQGWIDDRARLIFKIPEHSNEPLSDSLTALVKACGQPYHELAKNLRVSGTTVHKYMHGMTTLFSITEEDSRKMQFLRKIADYFDVKPTYFREYRIVKLIEKLLDDPEMIDIMLELSKKSRQLKKFFYEDMHPFKELEIEDEWGK
jgi:transcriptional regulator with XRE-family HTH domain